MPVSVDKYNITLHYFEVNKMNGANKDVLRLDILRERKKALHNEVSRENNAEENVSLEDSHDKKTFGKTLDGAGE